MSTSCGWEGKGRYSSFCLQMNEWMNECAWFKWRCHSKTVAGALYNKELYVVRNAGCAGKTVLSLDNVCHTWAHRDLWRRYKNRLPLTFFLLPAHSGCGKRLVKRSSPSRFSRWHGKLGCSSSCRLLTALTVLSSSKMLLVTSAEFCSVQWC